MLIVVGLLAFARGGAAPTTAGRVGSRLAMSGALLDVAAHALSLVAHDAALDDLISVAVLSSFAVGTLLTAVGLILAGTSTLRSGVWSGWRRHTPLVLGAWMAAMTPLQFTPALPLAVGIYALAVMAFRVSDESGRALDGSYRGDEYVAPVSPARTWAAARQGCGVPGLHK